MSMSKATTPLKIIICALLLGVTVSLYAVTPEDKTLLRQGYLLHQLWAMARNYAYGTTVSKNSIRAYAFALLYSKALPDSYPGKKSLLERFERPLDSEELKLGKAYAKDIIRKYRIGFHFDEKSLYRLFELKREVRNFKVTDQKNFKNLDDFLGRIKREDNSFYEQVKNKKEQDKQATYIYGQLHLEGSEPVNMMVSNQELIISPKGFFFGLASTPQLVFNFPGYQGFSERINLEDQLINLNHITLKKASSKNRANVVGRLSPLRALKDTDIVLRLANYSQYQDEPYLIPLIPVTRLSDGQFYVKGLAATQYELVIKYKDKQVTKTFTLHAGNYKALPPITLDKD